jgi:hypothetical protein
MAMVIDADVAAYGLFQIAFATMDTRLSRSLVALGQRKNAKLSFANLGRKQFGRRLKKLREAIEGVKPDLQNDPVIEELELACNLAQSVQGWRNDRIHAEVRFLENRPVLVDEYGKPLRIDREACEEKIREAIRAGIAMEAAVPHLVAHEVDLEELIDEP